jgi:hypothetical protein
LRAIGQLLFGESYANIPPSVDVWGGVWCILSRAEQTMGKTTELVQKLIAELDRESAKHAPTGVVARGA